MDQSLTQRVMLPDETATIQLGADLAGALSASPAGWLILLQGDLGAGKSTMARSMLQTFGHAGTVPSPTYTLVEPYDFRSFLAYHIDLYRISSADELEFLGWDDLVEGLRIVEWPERIPDIEAEADLLITLSYDGEGRRAALRGTSERGAALLEGMNLN
ncbi:MAG: tRNA (adenosine(37)-N6)-threonylcarbamoyltransferase complex ATPase subunit type 1 TsaE [Woeseiaceae bacterium]|nr:tRNA (adenosine(37)-N6)-threonylcarbamoyltransferase complex ATPase subunit type 1 TsaE [Woeseiaceae bacterium]